MDSQQLLQINSIIVIGLIVYFFVRSKSGQPTRLKLREGMEMHENKAETQSTTSTTALLDPQDLRSQAEPPSKSQIEVLPAIQPSSAKIYFVYNGHEWECHEVLGLQRGCTIQQATEVYQDLIKSSDPSTFEFYESAFTALLRRKSSASGSGPSGGVL